MGRSPRSDCRWLELWIWFFVVLNVTRPWDQYHPTCSCQMFPQLLGFDVWAGHKLALTGTCCVRSSGGVCYTGTMPQPLAECLTNSWSKILPLVLLPPLPLENHVRILGESTFCWGEKNPTFRVFFVFHQDAILKYIFSRQGKNMERSWFLYHKDFPVSRYLDNLGIKIINHQGGP